MTSLVAGRVATVMDPMFTAKMNEVSNFKIAQFALPSLTAVLNLLRTDYFATGGNGSDFIQLIIWSEKKSSEASRSLPGHASIILCCRT